MIERVILAGFLCCVASGFSYLLSTRRRPDPPSVPSYKAPSMVDREDFLHNEQELLIVLFASHACDSCITVREVLESFVSEQVAVQYVYVEDTPSLHTRYRIDGVPTTLVVDSSGEVLTSYFGFIDQRKLEVDLSQI